MVTREQVNQLQTELEQLRTVLVRDRRSAAVQIDALLDRADRLRTESAGGDFEPSITAVHDLLQSLRRGVTAQMGLRFKSFK